VSTQREYTAENIISLNPNEVFVFGSNTEGRHGAGAAKTALDKFGAKYGQAEGLQGQSYGLITKDLAKGKRSRTKGQLFNSITDLMDFAYDNPELKFYVTKLGTERAGFTESEMKEIFKEALDFDSGIPENVVLPIEFEVRDKDLTNFTERKDTEEDDSDDLDNNCTNPFLGE
jgi:hypothetical protein